MSTKIRNGYRLPGDTNVPALCRVLTQRMTAPYRDQALSAVAITSMLLMSVRPDADNPDADEFKMVVDIANSLACDQLVETDLHFGQMRIDIPLLMRAAEVVDAIQAVFTRPHPKYVCPGFDLSLSISFMSDPEGESFLYATLYSDLPVFDRVWKSVPGVEPYFYWDNSDRPSRITNREWETRSEVWDRVLGDAAPAEVGITWTHRPRELVYEALDRKHSKATAWLTERRVADRLIRLSTDKERMRARRAEICERLTGPRIGVVTNKPAVLETTGYTEPQSLEAVSSDDA